MLIYLMVVQIETESVRSGCGRTDRQTDFLMIVFRKIEMKWNVAAAGGGVVVTGQGNMSIKILGRWLAYQLQCCWYLVKVSNFSMQLSKCLLIDCAFLHRCWLLSVRASVEDAMKWKQNEEETARNSMHANWFNHKPTSNHTDIIQVVVCGCRDFTERPASSSYKGDREVIPLEFEHVNRDSPGEGNR